MGVLTESTAHLRDEIVTSRQTRAAFRRQLVEETKARQVRVGGLLAAFAGDLAGARRAWFGLTPAGPRAIEREKQRRLAEGARAEPRQDLPATPPLAPHPKGRKKH